MNAGVRQATGELLWFLHADSTVPPDWREQLKKAMADPHVVGGAFQVKINAPGLRYRLLDLWGRWRPFIQRSFFGDQGIFVRRTIFERLGGFRELPVLEDVDFSHRLWRAGKVALLPGPLRTSARRWETKGFWRTVWRHSYLSVFGCASDLSGKVPRISAAYLSVRHRVNFYKVKAVSDTVVVIMAKAPIPGQVKTRLVPPLTPEQAADLAKRLLQETVKLVVGLNGIRPMVAVAPKEGIEQVRRLLANPASSTPTLSGPVPVGDCPLQLIPQSDGDLGMRLSEVFRQSFSDGARGVIALGADHPGLPKAYLEEAISALKRSPDHVILGPTEDGGYYLIGLNRFHPELFEGIPWSTNQVAAVTSQRAQALGLSVHRLPPWFDIDRPEDLDRLRYNRGKR